MTAAPQLSGPGESERFHREAPEAPRFINREALRFIERGDLSERSIDSLLCTFKPPLRGISTCWAILSQFFVSRPRSPAQQVRRLPFDERRFVSPRATAALRASRVLAILAVALALPASAAADPPEPIRIVIDAEPAHLNPILDPDLWGYRISHDLICEPLWRPVFPPADPESPAAYEGVLAESFHLDDDHAGIAVVLRKGVRFHDGRPLTARDVRFTLERLQESWKVAPRTRTLVADLYRVEVISDTRLHLLFRRAGGRFLSDLAQVDILPEHLFSHGSLAHQPQNRHPICTGPYRLKEWRRASGRNSAAREAELVLTRDPGYWGQPPPTEELRFLVVPDAARGLAKLHRGEAEILGRLPPLYSPEQVDPTALRGRLRPIEIPANQMLLLLWNRHNPVLSSARTRRALSLLIDRAKLVSEVRHGLGEPINLPPMLPSGVGSGVPSSDSAQRSGGPFSDEAAAATLLDEAGLRRLTEGGPRARDNRPVHLKVLVPAGSSEAQGVFRRIAEAAGRAGLTLESVSDHLDDGGFQGRLRQGAFDLAIVSWAWTGAAPDLSRLLRSGSAQIPLGVESQDLDAALDALRRASSASSATRQAVKTRIASLLTELEPVTFLYRPRQLILVNRRLQPAELPRSGDFLRFSSLYLGAPP